MQQVPCFISFLGVCYLFTSHGFDIYCSYISKQTYRRFMYEVFISFKEVIYRTHLISFSISPYFDFDAGGRFHLHLVGLDFWKFCSWFL